MQTALIVIQKVDSERLQRGVEGLTAGAYRIKLTRQDAEGISGYVANGDGKEYAVTLTEQRSFCGCGDAMVRGKTCKHGVALALFVIRNPQAEIREESTPSFDLKLAKVRRTA
jgi:uncharacterized Zn finger protein